MRVALIADTHACGLWMTPKRLRYMVEQVQAQSPDLILLLGDYMATHKWVRERIPAADWAGVFGALSAPLCVHAIMRKITIAG